MIRRVINQIEAWWIGLNSQCHHAETSQRFAMAYCLALACAYVGSLYVLVPPKVRKLNRDDPYHIQWRTVASILVCAGAVGTYPLFFCDLEGPATFGITKVVLRQWVQNIIE